MKHKKIACLLTALTVAATPASALSFNSYEELQQHLCNRWGICLENFQKPICPNWETPERPTPPESELPEVTPPQAPEFEKPEVLPPQAPETETPEVVPPQMPETEVAGYAAQVAKLVNAERAKYGLPALTWDSTVSAAAQVRAQEIVENFSHTRPDGSSCFTALQQNGVNYRGAGENIAYGQSSPEAVVAAWMASPGHRANILQEKFTTIGVGYHLNGGTPYWTQFFTY